jgi:hypothetical protein
VERRLRLFLGWLSLVGAILGVAIFSFLLFQPGKLQPLAALSILLGLTFFAVGAYTGWAAIAQLPGWRRLLAGFWLAQLPMLSFPVFSFFSSVGLGAWVFASSEPRLGASFYIGSQLGFTAGNPGPFHPYSAVGLNVIAALVLALILRSSMRRET